MIDLLEMQSLFAEDERTFLQKSTYDNWQTYYLRVCSYYKEMSSDARYIEVKDIVKSLQKAISFLKNNLPLECYEPYHLEIETLARMDYFLEQHLKEIKIKVKSIF